MVSKENYGELRVRHSDDYRLSRLARAGDALGLEAALKADSELDSDYAKMAMLEAARTSLA